MARPSTQLATQGLDVEVIPAKELKVMSTLEYAEYSKANGRYMGREEGVKTKLTTDELRILMNEGWTADEVKDKHGLNDEELKQVVWKLSKEEQRDKPIKFGK